MFARFLHCTVLCSSVFFSNYLPVSFKADRRAIAFGHPCASLHSPSPQTLVIYIALRLMLMGLRSYSVRLCFRMPSDGSKLVAQLSARPAHPFSVYRQATQ